MRLAFACLQGPDGNSVHRFTPEDAAGTVPFMAPEVFKAGRSLDASVDLYAFGVLMWSLFTGESPYPGMNDKEVVRRVLGSGLRPTFPHDTPPHYK